MSTKSNNTGGRGGKRPGAGRKKKAVLEKVANGILCRQQHRFQQPKSSGRFDGKTASI